VRDGAGELEDNATAETVAQPAPRQRRTLGSVTRVALDAVSHTGQPSTAQTQPSQEASSPRSAAPTRALVASSAGDAAKPVVIGGARKPKLPAPHVVPRRSGPRSWAAQFVVAMIATAMVASALTLSTPLGEAAALSAGGPLTALSNAAPWIPTPTPTPKPAPPQTFRPLAGANPGQQAVINEIVAVFGPNAQGALNIAKCESGYDPNAWNSYPIMGSHASGVFQILYPSTWNTTSYASQSPFDATANINAAYQIFHRDGDSWREWQCKSY
jgi:hypothetical protein